MWVLEQWQILQPQTRGLANRMSEMVRMDYLIRFPPCSLWIPHRIL